ncbi:WGxxGxxG family protein [Streptomyces roseolilacinus]|uniref:MYXO-CTERM domain-containing protein n=1 Tax=Streptomyces roseolilacinus TaxID=66904 RepID=A0A918EL35_9ACTN|nr:WGxxGxxG family protein [Streptomyces roseolilacinus]GGQ10700.1 hypothetical protein GCM10010249_31450 [Streptomyces roseolilacinus]
MTGRGGAARRTATGALLAAALLTGPAAATAAAQAPAAAHTSAVRAAPVLVTAEVDRDKDDDNGGWGLWGLAGLLGLLGLIPRRSKTHGTGNHRGSSPGTGGGAHPTDRI